MSQTYKRLGELLVENGLISSLQLSVALAAQATSNRRIGEILVERGFVSEDQIARCLAEQYGYPLADVMTIESTKEALQAVGPDNALAFGVLPLRLTDEEFECVIADPLDVASTDQVSQLLKKRVKVQIAPLSRLQKAIRSAYSLDEPVARDLYADLSALPQRFAQPRPRWRFGTVAYFDAYDETLDRPVTVATVPIGTPDEDAHYWLVRAAARANGMGTCSVHDWFVHGEHNLAVLERLEGETLEHILKTRGARTVPQAADLVATIAQAVDASNQAGGWCGLVCTSNVLVRRGGAILVPITTPPERYSCPEIQEGGQATPASDIFALGTLLWECVTGKQQHIGGWGLPAKSDDSIPPALADIIRQCLEVSPKSRPLSAVQLATAMRSYNWFAFEAGKLKQGDAGDREALLDEILGDARPQKPNLWSRLFGRRAA
jgi:hypothetical protein